MKIKYNNTNKIVHNAHIRKANLSFSVIINTVNNWVTFDTSHGDQDYYCWDFYGKDVNKDTVSVEAENKHDKEIIRWLRFELHDKSQIWIIFLAPEVLK